MGPQAGKERGQRITSLPRGRPWPASTIRRLRHAEAVVSVPDQIAVLRILLVPAVMALVLAEDGLDHNFGIAAAVFAVAAVSDFLDGYLARRWELTTTFGAFLDTIADKLLVTGALFALVEVGRAWAWAAFIIVGREIAVMGLRGVAALEGTRVPPSLLGKVKAVTQFLAIGLAILRPEDQSGPLFLDEYVMILAVAITVVSAIEYFAAFGRVRRSATR